jgi:hypothetical protein
VGGVLHPIIKEVTFHPAGATVASTSEMGGVFHPVTKEGAFHSAGGRWLPPRRWEESSNPTPKKVSSTPLVEGDYYLRGGRSLLVAEEGAFHPAGGRRLPPQRWEELSWFITSIESKGAHLCSLTPPPPNSYSPLAAPALARYYFFLNFFKIYVN